MVAAAIPTDRPETKLCVTCLCERPVEEFRRRYRGTDKAAQPVPGKLAPKLLIGDPAEWEG